MKIKLTSILVSLICLAYGQSFQVVRVIDGDTFELENSDRVRMIGINAPELSDIYGIEAKEYLARLVEGKIVTLVPDQRRSDKDRYQRLLRYVYFDGQDINKKMISDGYAFAYLRFNFTKSDEYRNAQLKAKAQRVGIWSQEENTEFTMKIDNGRRSDFSDIPRKAFVIGALVLVLIVLGTVYYFKK